MINLNNAFETKGQMLDVLVLHGFLLLLYVCSLSADSFQAMPLALVGLSFVAINLKRIKISNAALLRWTAAVERSRPCKLKLIPVYTGGWEPLLSHFPLFEEPVTEGLPCPEAVLCGQQLTSLSSTRQARWAAVNLWQPVGSVNAVAAISAKVFPATPRRVNANRVTVLPQIGRFRIASST